MNDPDDPEDVFDFLLAANREFQNESDLSSMQLAGLVGYHIFYSNDGAREDLTVGVNAAIHQAFDELTQEMWIDEDGVRERHGEVTPETVGKAVGRQFEEFAAWDFADHLAEEVARQLRDREENLRDDSEEGDRDE